MRAALKFLGALQTATGSDAFRTCIVTGLRKLVPADRCSFSYFHPGTHRATWIADGGSEPADPAAARFLAAHLHHHPAFTRFRRTGEVRWVRLSDLTTKRRFHHSVLYNEWYRHVGVEYQATVLFSGIPRGIVAPALSRDGRRDFAERELTLLGAVLPHLVQAYRGAANVTRLQQEMYQLGQGLETARIAVIMLAEDRRIHLTTTLARQRLAEYFGRRPRNTNRLPTSLLDWVVQHDRRPTALDDVPRPVAPLVVTAGTKRLVVRLVGEPGRRVLFLDEQYVDMSLATVEQLGLRRREAEILKWVAAGKRDGEIATILAISPRTVHHHLERIYRKLNVETRTAAAAMAMHAARQGE